MSNTQLLIKQMQDVSTRGSLSTAYTCKQLTKTLVQWWEVCKMANPSENWGSGRHNLINLSSNRIWNGRQLNYTEQVLENSEEIYSHIKAHCNYSESNHIFLKKLQKFSLLHLGMPHCIKSTNKASRLLICLQMHPHHYVWKFLKPVHM